MYDIMDTELKVSQSKKYLITLSSGRDFIMDTDKDEYTIAYDAYEEACLMDDYLVDIERVG
tara:strand:+ start:560 stop:742 length:183 start_codon:yes stop_codon:yes gene_type:complete